jgi:hypothetical protein
MNGVSNTGNLTYGSRSYVLLCYAKMRGTRWFSRDDYRRFQLHKPRKIEKLATTIDRLINLGFLEMRIEKDTEYYRITTAGSVALVALGVQKAEENHLKSVENAKRHSLGTSHRKAG